MIDHKLRPLIDPPLNLMGRRLARAGLRANQVTVSGLVLGLAAAAFIAHGQFWAGLALILASRLADGLDGAVARATLASDFGGYLDIVADFTFYAAIPLAFVWHDPSANGLAGAFLLAGFYVNAASFLGYAALAEKKRMQSRAQGEKSIYFSAGLLEGFETIAFFVLICLFPANFPALALVFGALCFLTAAQRLVQAARVFR
ncbi:MAG: CDP-alcohol phosphatidyltransferase family protein [Pararhodobacter sp.]|nr:CDP-alcohol phosphatidyltransferase family protein [Pararhodobacter sp.]